jgi:hypothetical protein
MPEVSVVVAVFNAAPWLGEAIESILGQTFADLELIVVDDGSTDGSPGIVRRYADDRIRLVELGRNGGQTAALNHGLRLATGTLIARLDADDRAHPTRLARQVEVLRADVTLGLVGSQAWRIDANGRRTGVLDRCLEDASIRWYGLFDNPFIHSSVTFRRSAIGSDGAYDERFAYAQDFELWSRVLSRLRGRNLAERLVDYRAHAGSRTGVVEHGVAVHQRSPQFRDRLEAVIGRNAAEIFDEAPPPSDVELMCGYVLGLEARLVPSFLTLFAGLLRRFRTLHPETAVSRDFRRTVARQYDAVAIRAHPASRRLALRVYAAAVRGNPELTRWLSWPRIVALTTVGAPGVNRLRTAAWR